MRLSDLSDKSILILGYGVEGIGTFKVLRELFPKQRIGIADSRIFNIKNTTEKNFKFS